MKEMKLEDIDISSNNNGKFQVTFTVKDNFLLNSVYNDLLLEMTSYNSGRDNRYYLMKGFYWTSLERVDGDQIYTKVEGTSKKVRIYDDKKEVVKEEI